MFLFCIFYCNISKVLLWFLRIFFSILPYMIMFHIFVVAEILLHLQVSTVVLNVEKYKNKKKISKNRNLSLLSICVLRWRCCPIYITYTYFLIFGSLQITQLKFISHNIFLFQRSPFSFHLFFFKSWSKALYILGCFVLINISDKIGIASLEKKALIWKVL